MFGCGNFCSPEMLLFRREDELIKIDSIGFSDCSVFSCYHCVFLMLNTCPSFNVHAYSLQTPINFNVIPSFPSLNWMHIKNSYLKSDFFLSFWNMYGINRFQIWGNTKVLKLSFYWGSFFFPIICQSQKLCQRIAQ